MDNRMRFNFQMTDIQAAIGRAQLIKLPTFMARRQAIFSVYQQAGLPLMTGGGGDGGAVRYRAILRSPQPARLIDRLAKAGVRAIVPVETGELLDTPEAYPAAAALTRSTLSVPIHPSMTDGQVRHVVQALEDVA
jgi:perosamine synthetase